MIISKRCVHGILAAVYIASQPPGEYIQIGVIADKLKISFHFLTKVLQQLTQRGILLSYRGPHGGVMLAKPSAEVTLYELIDAIDGDQIFNTCMLGLNGCGHETPCPLHDAWSETRTKLKHLALKTTLQELASNTDFLKRQIASSFMIGPAEIVAVDVVVPTDDITFSKA
jgi:Rrf2 family transcriptional regulator, iron-sulfur cluster assembly transcription factor